MNNFIRCIVLLVAAVALLSPAVRPEQSQKSSHNTQEDRVKKLEERADLAEKAANDAALEKDYIARTQKLYESYYQRTFSIQLWTLGIVGLLLVALFGLVAKFSLDLFEQRTKLAMADATAQMRNEHSRMLAKEVQKLWDSNAGDNKKLKEALTGQIALLEQNLKDMADFQMQFVQGLAGAAEENQDESVASFRQALAAYKLSKPRHLMEARVGVATARHIFDSLRKKHGEGFEEKIREELADALYDGLQEELAVAALQRPWLTPFINERVPTKPEPPAPEIANEPRAAESMPKVLATESDQFAGEEFESSCRLITT
jgi:hypothetical protein